MRRVLEWNGRDLPAVLRELSPGRYCIDDDREGSGDEKDALRKLAARAADRFACE